LFKFNIFNIKNILV